MIWGEDRWGELPWSFDSIPVPALGPAETVLLVVTLLLVAGPLTRIGLGTLRAGDVREEDPHG